MIERTPVITVFTSGCFDLVTATHCLFLAQSKALGNRLVVGLNTDNSVRRLKGRSRPIVPYEQRKTVLLSLQCVDDVVPLEADEPSWLIRQIRPHVVTKAKGYSRENMPEWDAIEEVGGKVVFLETQEGLSTTEIIARCRK